MKLYFVNLVDDPVDYQGRNFLHAPHDVGVNLRSDSVPTKCFIPKKQIHIWQGHNKGVAQIRWFPKTAHLLLSGSMDCRVKVSLSSLTWSKNLNNFIHRYGKCTRTAVVSVPTLVIDKLYAMYVSTTPAKSSSLRLTIGTLNYGTPRPDKWYPASLTRRFLIVWKSIRTKTNNIFSWLVWQTRRLYV